MEEIKISIIIPCYNCEKYIKKNIESILNQTYKSFETIYIDDGSTDNTLNILMEYEKKDSRINVIHINNKGVSNARNVGINNSKGRYITFIDSDDYVDEIYLYKLYVETENEKFDYVKCKMRTEENTQDKKCTKEFICSRDTNFNKIYELLLKTYNLNQVTCGLIRSSIIKEKNIRFDIRYSYAEDLNFNIDLFQNINTFKYINYNGYFYTNNPESITKKIELKKTIKTIEAVSEVYSRLHLLITDKKKVEKKIESEIIHVLDSLFYANTIMKKNERMKVYNKVKMIVNKEICNTLDMKLIYNKLYQIYDFKNYLIKKVPRKIKSMLLKGKKDEKVL